MRGGERRRSDRSRRPAKVAALLLCATALTQPASARAATTATPWSIYASTYTYVLQHDRDYVNVNLGLDGDHVHVEARFDYEDLDTGSLWVGYNIDLSGQGEYVLDTGTRCDDFFYARTELSYAPARWLRFGGAIQHTKAYETGLDVQRGPLVGMSLGRFDLTVYLFNPDKPDPPVVLGVAASF